MDGTDPSRAVLDAGPLIHLDELDCLDLLEGFADMRAPVAVWEEVRLILVRVQVETNYPRPGADAPHSIVIRSQPWQARFQGSHHPGHV